MRGGRTVIEDLSLDVSSGRVTGLLGPSGCGKSTLMRAIVGVQVVAGGRVEVLGRAAGEPSLRHDVGYLTQSPSVYARPDGDREPAVLRRGDGSTGSATWTRCSPRSRSRMPPGRSSARSRAASGRAPRSRRRSSTVPTVLVLDEPTVGLDPILRADLWQSFHELADAGATLLVSSHSMEEAAECDDLLLMREGAILAADHARRAPRTHRRGRSQPRLPRNRPWGRRVTATARRVLRQISATRARSRC